jgi:hypothetical protein
MLTMPLPSDEQLLASATHYLIQGQQQSEAMLLLLCSVEVHGGQWEDAYEVWLTGPRAAYDALKDREHPQAQAIKAAFEAVLPGRACVSEVVAKAQLVDIENSDWRTELLEEVHGRGIHNQGTEMPSRKIVLWKNLRFRSEAERRIAAALDATGVLFLPNCMARLNIGDQRGTREPDFLICRDGKWGILEVDGPYHNARAALDHERDELFQNYQISVVRRFTAEQCLDDAPAVVRRFLELLQKNG